MIIIIHGHDLFLDPSLKKIQFTVLKYSIKANEKNKIFLLSTILCNCYIIKNKLKIILKIITHSTKKLNIGPQECEVIQHFKKIPQLLLSQNCLDNL